MVFCRCSPPGTAPPPARAPPNPSARKTGRLTIVAPIVVRPVTTFPGDKLLGRCQMNTQDKFAVAHMTGIRNDISGVFLCNPLSFTAPSSFSFGLFLLDCSKAMLGPTGKVLRLYRTKHVHALIAAFFSGIEVNAVTGGPPAVWRSPKAAQTELELAGSPAVFPAQHLRLYHTDFPVQIILIEMGCSPPL